MKIYISNNTGARVSFKIKRIIRRAIRASVMELVGAATCRPTANKVRLCEVSVVLVNNEEIHALNLQHRNMDKPTDVLSFPMDDEILGDIVISMEQAKIQAENYNHSFEREIGFLTVHSMLHLFGYDHETPEDEEEMFALQEKILREMKLVRK